MKKTLITEVSGVVEAPPARVHEALARRFTPDEVPDHPGTVEVTERMIAYQGGWWYRGEWTLSEHPQGTLVTHRVYNVAESMRWGVSLANRFFIGYDEATRDSFSKGINQLGEELGCPARLT
ncbi:hypothetical protein ABZ297_04715 [Nonomuraea sp. NPDC005983]|uniref:hypothetical protein n=1 Tax=Nonomuraea sp. NPDC005983 TaxID=3155595 RepID=UPI0033B99515